MTPRLLAIQVGLPAEHHHPDAHDSKPWRTELDWPDLGCGACAEHFTAGGAGGPVGGLATRPRVSLSS